MQSGMHQDPNSNCWNRGSSPAVTRDPVKLWLDLKHTRNTEEYEYHVRQLWVPGGFNVVNAGPPREALCFRRSQHKLVEVKEPVENVGVHLSCT